MRILIALLLLVPSLAMAGGPYPEGDFSARSDGTSISPDLNFTVPSAFAEKTDIKWDATVDNNNTSVYVQYNLVLVDN